MKAAVQRFACTQCGKCCNAPFGAMTTSMRVAWQIAAAAGLIGGDDYKALIATQLDTIGRELAAGRCMQDARETLADGVSA